MHDGGSVGLDVTLLLIPYTERPQKPRSANETYIKTIFPTIIDHGKDVLLRQLVSEAGRLIRYHQ
jgi:hypothetical protein